MTLGKSDSPAREADEFATRTKATVRRRSDTSVHGFPVVVVESDIAAEDGTLRVLSYFIEKDDNVYIFHGIAGSTDYTAFEGTFERIMTGFDKLEDERMLSRQPRRLRIRTAPRDGDLRSVLKALDVPDEQAEELAILNERELDDSVRRGERIKVVGD